VNLNQAQEGHEFQMFRNCLSQIYEQQYENQILSNSYNNSNKNNQTQKSIPYLLAPPPPQPLPQAQQQNLNKILMTKNDLHDSNEDLPKPRNLNDTLKQSVINNGNYSISESDKLKLNFQHDGYSISKNFIVGSYHSVSDISVLSDNEDDSSSAFFPNGSKTMPNRNNHIQPNEIKNDFSYGLENSINKLKTNFLSQSDDFKFKQPFSYENIQASKSSSNEYITHNKKEYNQNLYSNDSYSSSTNTISRMTTNKSDNSSLSGSENQVYRQDHHTNFVQPSHPPSILKNNKIVPKVIKNENSKSMLYGIPRDSPKPTITSRSTEFESPFPNITLNNIEDYTVEQENEEEEEEEVEEERQQALLIPSNINGIKSNIIQNQNINNFQNVINNQRLLSSKIIKIILLSIF
jgi:hypothetical protein